MPVIHLQVSAGLARNIRPEGSDSAISWQSEVAPGDTLGRLLERLSYEQAGFGAVYDQSARRVARGAVLLVNGQPYRLMGGLTYLLNEGDVISAEPAET